jgi:hypothetical protein
MLSVHRVKKAAKKMRENLCGCRSVGSSAGLHRFQRDAFAGVPGSPHARTDGKREHDGGRTLPNAQPEPAKPGAGSCQTFLGRAKKASHSRQFS